MSIQTKCQTILSYGPKRGELCNRDVSVNSSCELCNTIKEVKEIFPKQDLDVCKNHSDPYNQEQCCRTPVYKGYCFLCLSQG